MSRRLADASSLGRGEIIGTTRDMVDGRHVGGTDDPFEFQLLRGNAILGLDVAVRSMAVGERARFVIRADYAYGAEGDSFKVRGGDALELDVELVRIEKSLPRLPTKVGFWISTGRSLTSPPLPMLVISKW